MSSHNFTLLLTLMGIFVASATINGINVDGYEPPDYDYVINNQPQCGKNEIFNQCVKPCEPTCQNSNPKDCPLFCTYGCKCKEGFRRDENRKCVICPEPSSG